MAKVGDFVRFLNSVGGGRIIRIDGSIAHVEDEDGFEIPILIKECVVVDQPAVSRNSNPVATDHVAVSARNQAQQAPSSNQSAPSAVAPTIPDDEIEETVGGDTLNIVLAYEPQEIKHLNTTLFDAYLVNDSNYYLYFSYMTKGDGEDGWTTRYAGIIEPNMQVLLESFAGTAFADIDRIACQYIAFKQGKPFALKTPVLVEYNLDTTRFFKLHCFRENPYFDNQVIAYDIVKDDRPQRQHSLDSSMVEKAVRQKKSIDRRPVQKRQIKKTARRVGEIIEVDLHINELIDNTNGLSSADMLNYQIDEFRRVMDKNIKVKGQKIVFIHGKGEGVLRNAIMKELNHRYKGHQVQDASFQEYGYGATQVTI